MDTDTRLWMYRAGEARLFEHPDHVPPAKAGSAFLYGQARAKQAAVGTAAPTNSTPYGFSEAQAQAIITLLNEIRATLVGAGLMKGQ